MLVVQDVTDVERLKVLADTHVAGPPQKQCQLLKHLCAGCGVSQQNWEGSMGDTRIFPWKRVASEGTLLSEELERRELPSCGKERPVAKKQENETDPVFH